MQYFAKQLASLDCKQAAVESQAPYELTAGIVPIASLSKFFSFAFVSLLVGSLFTSLKTFGSEIDKLGPLRQPFRMTFFILDALAKCWFLMVCEALNIWKVKKNFFQRGLFTKELNGLKLQLFLVTFMIIPCFTFRANETTPWSRKETKKNKNKNKKLRGFLYQDLLKFVPAAIRKIKCTNSPMILMTL